MGNEASNLKRQGTGKSALGLVVIAIAAIALVGLAVWVFMHPDILKNVIYLVIVIVVALIIIGLIIAVAAFVIAIPYYAVKGEQYQDGVDYSLDDVKPVRESSSDDKKNE